MSAFASVSASPFTRPHRLPRSSTTWLSCILLAASAMLPTASQAADTSLGEGMMLNVVALSSTRIAQATFIARWKWYHKDSDADPEQDKVMMEGVMQVAPHFGLDPAYTAAFFEDQEKASQKLQADLLKEWKTGTPPPYPDDAAFESARAEIYRLTQAMLSGLARVQPLSTEADCPIMLGKAINRWTTQMTTLDGAQKSALNTALSHVCKSGGIGGSA